MPAAAAAASAAQRPSSTCLHSTACAGTWNSSQGRRRRRRQHRGWWHRRRHEALAILRIAFPCLLCAQSSVAILDFMKEREGVQRSQPSHFPATCWSEKDALLDLLLSSHRWNPIDCFSRLGAGLGVASTSDCHAYLGSKVAAGSADRVPPMHSSIASGCCPQPLQRGGGGGGGGGHAACGRAQPGQQYDSCSAAGEFGVSPEACSHLHYLHSWRGCRR